jgi:hypothetical protein
MSGPSMDTPLPLGAPDLENQAPIFRNRLFKQIYLPIGPGKPRLVSYITIL